MTDILLQRSPEQERERDVMKKCGGNGRIKTKQNKRVLLFH